jgi:plastocyanin
MMEPAIAQPQPDQPKQKNVLVRLGIVAVIIAALAIIVVSIFTLVNPNGIETAADETEATVTMSDEGVSPATVRIARGETVTWQNDSQAPRQLVITSSNPQQDLEGFGSDEATLQGESYSFTFDSTGTFTYEDASSPDVIKGTVIVE